jgi:hypothetical protein
MTTMTSTKTMTDARRPIHIVVMIGASTALYAMSMAGVTAIQSSADRDLIRGRSPAEDAAARLRGGNDRLEMTLTRAADAYADAAARYDALAPQLDGMERSLDTLAGRVEAVGGAARSLPQTVTLPNVPRSAPAVSRPRTSATTGASGG